MHASQLSKLNDQEILHQTKELLVYERKAVAKFLPRLAELEDRRLYAKEGYATFGSRLRK